jgi:hypothetical protein
MGSTYVNYGRIGGPSSTQDTPCCRDRGPAPGSDHLELEESRVKAYVTGPMPLTDEQIGATLTALAQRALPAGRWPMRIEVTKRYPASQPTRVTYLR